jgi:streptomycin 6-kinase
MAEFPVPARLAARCGKTPEIAAWAKSLPGMVAELQARWRLQLGAPYEQEVSCAWVAPATRQDGTHAALKLGFPHMEAEEEIEGLRFWDGEPTAQLLEADKELNALLLERCEPGTPLRTLPEPEQDVVLAGLLRRLWRVPTSPHPFRPLAEMTAYWAEESLEAAATWPDAGLARQGLRLFADLPRSAPAQVLLATDLHAGNVLCAQRQPWLVIDPKPFVGDPAYDLTQHLLNCIGRLEADARGFIRRMAELCEVDAERVRLWCFARLAAEAGWSDWPARAALAQALAP